MAPRRIGTTIERGDVAVITGAGSGLGRALSVAVGYRGGRVFVTDIDRAGAEQTAMFVEEAGGEAVVETVDTRDPDALTALAQATYDRWGRCDLLINNAGVGAGGRIGEAPLDDWRWVIDINLYGVLYGCRAFAPRMKADGLGTIVNIASIAAFARAPMMGAYNVSKTGVVALSETLRAECLPHGVGVTVVCPAFFRTNIGRNSRASGEASKMDIRKLVEGSKVSAESIAEKILAGVADGDHYVVPTPDARLMWYLRRLSPGGASALFARLAKFAAKRAKRSEGKAGGRASAGVEA